MANLSDLSRKEQVLTYLRARTGLWVDGPELANEQIGGSEGLKRLRELRQDDRFDIRTRKHPDPDRDIWQYRLVPGRIPITERIEPAEKPAYPREPTPREPVPQPPRASPWPADHGQPRIAEAISRKEDGTFEYVPPQRPLEQLTVDAAEPTQPIPAAFHSMPAHVIYGEVAICPRCHSKTTRGRPRRKKLDPSVPTMVAERTRKKGDDGSSPLMDENGILLFRDPHSNKAKPCDRCNGYGIVPNAGPIALTMPDD